MGFPDPALPLLSLFVFAQNDVEMVLPELCSERSPSRSVLRPVAGAERHGDHSLRAWVPNVQRHERHGDRSLRGFSISTEVLSNYDSPDLTSFLLSPFDPN